MISGMAWVMDAMTIRNLCFLYFLLTPVFLDRKDSLAILLVFGVGYVVSGVIVLLAVGEKLSTLAHHIRYNFMTVLVGALVVTSFFSVLVNTPGSFMSPSLMYYKYGKLVLPVLVFFVMVRIWDRSDLPSLARLLLLFGFFSLGVALIEVLIQIGSPKGLARIGTWMVGDANKYAVILNILHGFLLAEFIAHKMAGRKAPWIGWGIVLVALGVLMTQSRGGALGFLVITLVCLFASRSGQIIRWGVGMMIPFGIMAVLVFLYRSMQPAGVELSDLGRVWTYIVAWNSIQRNPVFGIGFGNTEIMYTRYGQDYQILLRGPMDVHNIVIEIFAQQGVVGLVVFLAFLLAPFIVLTRRILTVSRVRYPLEEVAAIVVPLAFICYGMISHQYIANEFFWAYMSFTVIVMSSPYSGNQTLFGEATPKEPSPPRGSS